MLTNFFYNWWKWIVGIIAVPVAFAAVINLNVPQRGIAILVDYPSETDLPKVKKLFADLIPYLGDVGVKKLNDYEIPVEEDYTFNLKADNAQVQIYVFVTNRTHAAIKNWLRRGYEKPNTKLIWLPDDVFDVPRIRAALLDKTDVAILTPDTPMTGLMFSPLLQL